MTTHVSSPRCLLLAIAVGLLFSGPHSTLAQSSPPTSFPSGTYSANDSRDVLEVLRENEDYTVLIAALERTGIDQGLRISPSFTLLAPTDSAFEAQAVSPSEMTSEDVAEIVRNHVIHRALTSRQLRKYATIENTRGLSLQVGRGGKEIAGATLVDPDLVIENGIVHGIDTVLTLETAAQGTHPVQ